MSATPDVVSRGEQIGHGLGSLLGMQREHPVVSPITVDVQVYAERNPENPVVVKVTEAKVIFVALNSDGSKRVVPAEEVPALTRP